MTSGVLGVYVLAETAGAAGENTLTVVLFSVAFVVPIVAALLFFGLVAQATAFLINQVLSNAPLTLDLTKPHAPMSSLIMLSILALAAYGFYSSRAGQPVFGRVLQYD